MFAVFLFKLIVAIAAIIGALDLLFGDRLQLGQEFERGFKLWSTMALSMIGMILLAPWIAKVLAPFFNWVAVHTPLDPSILPASLFANDMGGAALCLQIAGDEAIGRFNGFVVSSMMGCTFSFTLPFSLGMVKKQQQPLLCQGILCGVVTIPVGCLVSGLVMGLPFGALLLDLLPLLLLSALIAVGLLKAPRLCTVVFTAVGYFMKALITVGLCIGILEFIPGLRILGNPEGFEEAALVCTSAAVLLAGMFPFFAILSRLLRKPLDRLAVRARIRPVSSVGLLSNLLSNAASLGTFEQMDDRGAVLNAAFAVSAAFVFGDHLSFTMAYCEEMVPYMILGKLVSGGCALAAAFLLLARNRKAQKTTL